MLLREIDLTIIRKYRNVLMKYRLFKYYLSKSSFHVHTKGLIFRRLKINICSAIVLLLACK